MKQINAILIIIILLSLAGCVIVKEKQQEQKPVVLQFSPTPEMEMSDVMVRSDEGDMVAFLPKDWFLVNLEDNAPANVISVAVDKGYTIALIFSRIKKNESNEKIVNREHLLGLARIAFEKRANKTAGAVKLAGDYKEINMGPRKFAQYEFTNEDKSKRAMSAVFISSLGNFYEMSVIPMNLTGIVPVSQYDLNKVFSSVLTTVEY